MDLPSCPEPCFFDADLIEAANNTQRNALFGKAITHFTHIACVLQDFKDGFELMKRLSKECRPNL